MNESSAWKWQAALARYGLVVGIAWLIGCVRYQPMPLAREQVLGRLESHSLADAGLRAFVATNAPDLAESWPRESWELRGLTLVGFYFNPSLDVVRASVGVAEAAVITAGGRPNPTVTFAPEYSANPGTGLSPWLMGLSFDIPIETAGKRGLRVAQASRLTDAARLELAAAGWRVRSRVRTTLLEHLVTLRETTLLQFEIAAHSNIVHLVERRWLAGGVPRPEVDATQIELVRMRVAERAAAGRIQETLSDLAAALGAQPSAMDGIALKWDDLWQIPDEQTLAPEIVQTAGLMNRIDIRRGLFEYAAAETALELEIARQYPEVHLQPGYVFDQGEHKFAFGLSLELPVLNQNQGPIAEANARREKVAAEFSALQAQVIAEVHKARAQYRAALSELHEVDTALIKVQERTERMTRRAVEIGETDRLALATVELQGLTIARTRLHALHRAQTALGALEDAVQRPLAPADKLPEVTVHRPRGDEERK